MLIATYGTFRKGEALSRHMDYLRINGRSEIVTLEGLKIYIIGNVPGAKLTGDKKDKAVAELIEAAISRDKEELILKRFDQVEGVDIGLYDRNKIDTPRGEAVMYTYRGDIKGCVTITDWMEWQAKSEKEKDAALAKMENKAGMVFV